MAKVSDDIIPLLVNDQRQVQNPRIFTALSTRGRSILWLQNNYQWVLVASSWSRNKLVITLTQSALFLITHFASLDVRVFPVMMFPVMIFALKDHTFYMFQKLTYAVNCVGSFLEHDWYVYLTSGSHSMRNVCHVKWLYWEVIDHGTNSYKHDIVVVIRCLPLRTHIIFQMLIYIVLLLVEKMTRTFQVSFKGRNCILFNFGTLRTGHMYANG